MYYFDKTISEGYNYIDIDKVALKEARLAYISHPILLKARLLYDGGYYQIALDKLQKQTFDNAEYYYRIARVKYKLDFKQNQNNNGIFKCIEFSLSKFFPLKLYSISPTIS